MMTLGLVFFLVGAPTPSFAQYGLGGPGTGVKRGDTVVPVDRYVGSPITIDNSGSMKLPVSVVNELKWMEHTLSSFTAFFATGGCYDLKSFFQEKVFSDRIQYVWVDKIPSFCPYARPPIGSLEGIKEEELIDLACTMGSTTYLVKPNLVHANGHLKMSDADFAHLILHERLRDEPVSNTGLQFWSILGNIDRGLNVIRKLQTEQNQGLYRKLELNEIKAIEAMRNEVRNHRILWVTGFEINGPTNQRHECSSYGKPYQIHPNGGGLAFDSIIHESAYVGIKVIAYDLRLGEHSMLVSDELLKLGSHSKVGKNVKVINLHHDGVVDLQLKDDVTIQNLSLRSKTKDSWNIHRLKLGRGAVIKDSALNLAVKGSLASIRVVMGHDSQIENSQINLEINRNLDRNTVVPRIIAGIPSLLIVGLPTIPIALTYEVASGFKLRAIDPLVETTETLLLGRATLKLNSNVQIKDAMFGQENEIKTNGSRVNVSNRGVKIK